MATIGATRQTAKGTRIYTSTSTAIPMGSRLRLSTGNDRCARLRHRLIEAADEFAGTAAEALIKTRDAIGEVRALRMRSV
jgi:hypothetical protein